MSISLKTVSHKIAANLYLVRQECGGAAAKPPKPVPTNHILCVDCSGSMYADLPKLRADLKKKLPKLLTLVGDTLSLIWFSGKNEHGVIFEGEYVDKPLDLARIGALLDRWLKPCSLTGFVDPLEAVSRMALRLRKKTAGSECSLIFLSDGMDNSWSRSQVLEAVENATDELASSTFVEYGYYADRQLLAAMAARAGGTLLFAKDFDSYEPQFSSAMRKKSNAARRKVSIEDDPIQGLVFALAGEELLTFDVENMGVHVPADVEHIFYLSTMLVGKEEALLQKGTGSIPRVQHGASAAAYAAVSLFSVRCQPKVVKALLGALGDVRLIDDFSKCFGKQRYSEFMESAKAAAFDPLQRWSLGYDANRVPRDDAFTVLDMLELLASDDENKLLVDHSSFKVDKISRGRIPAESALSKEDEAKIAGLQKEIAGTKDGVRIAHLSREIARIAARSEPLKFVKEPLPEGVSISGLTYNESTPNVSLLVRRQGYVDISSRLVSPEGAPVLPGTKIPERFPTYTFRNYAIVKDGLLNVDSLPFHLSKKTMEKLFELAKEGRIPDDVVKMSINKEQYRKLDEPEHLTTINFGALPLCNGLMVGNVSAVTAFEHEWSLVQVQARHKVYKALLAEVQETRVSQTYVQQYGQEGADFLRDLGFTDYSGFGPKMVQDKARDYYMAKTLDISIKGFAKLPSWNDYLKATASPSDGHKPGKALTPALSLMDVAAKEVAKQKEKLGPHQDRLAGWLKAEERAIDVERRRLLAEKARAVFGLVVGQSFFVEATEPDVFSTTMTFDAGSMKFAGLVCKAVMSEEKVEI